MDLTDVMSQAGLARYAEIGLVISIIAFIALVIWALRRPRREMDEIARSILDDQGKPGKDSAKKTEHSGGEEGTE
jgi:hypothetical protein